MSRSDFPDWQAKAASEALDEQRRHPRDYPITRKERLELEYDTPVEEDALAGLSFIDAQD